MLFEVQGKPVTAQPGEASGIILLNAIRDEKPFLSGWFTAAEPFEGPLSLFAVIDRQVFRIGGAKELRPLPDTPPETAHHRRFETIGKYDWPPAVARPKQVEVFLVSAANTAIPVGFAPRQDGLVLDYADRAQYFRHIQAPSMRMLDKEALAYHAKRFYDAHPTDPVLRASALIVVAYRLLENNQAGGEQGRQIIEAARPLLQHLGGFTRLPEYKWFISLADICYYMKVAQGDDRSDDALEFLFEIYRRRENLAIPGGAAQQLPNHTRSLFLLGTARWKAGRRQEAEEILLSAKDALRAAAPHWFFDNYFSAAELIMATQQVRACLLRLAILKYEADGVWMHPSYARGNPATEFNCLGYPTSGWVKNGII
jgi:hypothetical protein